MATYEPYQTGFLFCQPFLHNELPNLLAGVDSVWEQEKLEARKMLAVGAAESHTSGARFVRRRLEF